MRLWGQGQSWGSRAWSKLAVDSGLALNVEPTALADVLDVGGERKRLGVPSKLWSEPLEGQS
jgi:hypothetical protein